MTEINGLQPISPGMINKTTASDDTTMSPERLKRIAKDFESLFLSTIMKEMDKTVIESDIFNTSGMRQAKGIFRHFFSQELANQGGLGFWKDIYRDFSQHIKRESTTPSIEAEL